MKTKSKESNSRKKHNNEQFVRKLFPGSWIDNAKDYYVKYNLDIPKLYTKLKNNKGTWIRSTINKINGIGIYINKNGKLAFSGRLLSSRDSRKIKDQKPFLIDSSKKINEILNLKPNYDNIPENIKNYIAKIDKYVNIVHAHVLTNYKSDSYTEELDIIPFSKLNENITIIDNKDDLESFLNNSINNKSKSSLSNSINNLILPR
uniref:Uncharacterized protein n=1 Tax=viral metagenome TaxID=1070528 RepID=A0A6C0D107_9ZZZZ